MCRTTGSSTVGQTSLKSFTFCSLSASFNLALRDRTFLGDRSSVAIRLNPSGGRSRREGALQTSWFPEASPQPGARAAPGTPRCTGRPTWQRQDQENSLQKSTKPTAGFRNGSHHVQETVHIWEQHPAGKSDYPKRLQRHPRSIPAAAPLAGWPINRPLSRFRRLVSPRSRCWPMWCLGEGPPGSQPAPGALTRRKGQEISAASTWALTAWRRLRPHD